MDNYSSIMAIFQENRVETAVKVQDVLTKYGCNIRVRLGRIIRIRLEED